jgi:hypothetical protein
MTGKLERLVALGIEVVPMPGLDRHVVFARGGYASLVERTETGLGRIGASGFITEHGLAFLVWRGETAYFVAKQHELIATPDQIASLRQFSSDLERTLRAC